MRRDEDLTSILERESEREKVKEGNEENNSIRSNDILTSARKTHTTTLSLSLYFLSLKDTAKRNRRNLALSFSVLGIEEEEEDDF